LFLFKPNYIYVGLKLLSLPKAKEKILMALSLRRLIERGG